MTAGLWSTIHPLNFPAFLYCLVSLLFSLFQSSLHLHLIPPFIPHIPMWILSPSQTRRSPLHSWLQAPGPARQPARHTHCSRCCHTGWAWPSRRTAGAWKPANTHTYHATVENLCIWNMIHSALTVWQKWGATQWNEQRGGVQTWRSYLHGRVVHNRAVEGDFRVTAGNLFTALQEEAVTQLPAPTNEHTLGCIMCFIESEKTNLKKGIKRQKQTWC